MDVSLVCQVDKCSVRLMARGEPMKQLYALGILAAGAVVTPALAQDRHRSVDVDISFKGFAQNYGDVIFYQQWDYGTGERGLAFYDNSWSNAPVVAGDVETYLVRFFPGQTWTYNAGHRGFFEFNFGNDYYYQDQYQQINRIDFAFYMSGLSVYSSTGYCANCTSLMRSNTDAYAIPNLPAEVTFDSFMVSLTVGAQSRTLGQISVLLREYPPLPPVQPAPLPEPATWLSLILGCSWVGAALRSRQQSADQRALHLLVGV